MFSKKNIQVYAKIGMILIIPIFLAYLMSLFLGHSNTMKKEEKPVKKEVQKKEVDRKYEEELEEKINAILKKNDLSLDEPVDNLFDEVFDRWMDGGQNPELLEKMAIELNEIIEKSPVKKKLQIPVLPEDSWTEEKLMQIKAANNHPLDLSLENCVEQNLDQIGKCFLSHIQLWEKDVKNYYDLILAKTKGKRKQEFITAQESWYNNLLAQQKFEESMLPNKTSKQRLAESKIDLLFQILQRIKDRALELEEIKNKL